MSSQSWGTYIVWLDLENTYVFISIEGTCDNSFDLGSTQDLVGFREHYIDINFYTFMLVTFVKYTDRIKDTRTSLAWLLRLPCLGDIWVILCNLNTFPAHVEKCHTSLFYKATDVELVIHSGLYLSVTVQLEVRYIATSAGCPPLSRCIFNKLSAPILSEGSSNFVWKMDLVWCRKS